MRKKVEFYKIDYSFMPLLEAASDSNDLKKEFIDSIMSSIDTNPKYIKQSVPLVNNTNILIETLDKDQTYLFGIIAKLEDMRDGNLKRFRDKEDIEIIDSVDENIDYYVENYTYFYIRLSDFSCAVMSNSSAPKFRMHFNNYLRDVTRTLGLESLNIINIYDDKIEEKINKTVELSELKMVFDSSSVMGEQLIDLENSFHLSQSDLKEAKVDITLKMQTLSKESKRLLKNNEVLKSDFKRLEIVGIDDEDKEVNIELIERILTKRVSITLDENSLKSDSDMQKIKEALRDSF